LPIKQISNGVVDAFVHVIEQYLTYPVNAPIQDGFAETILRTLIQEGPKALADPNDYDTRANVMWAATMALDHAQTLAIVLPSLMYKQKHHKNDKIQQLGREVFKLSGLSDDKLVEATIDATRAFFEKMEVKTRISEYGLDKSAIDKVMVKLEQNQRLQLGEHSDITLDVSKEILELAYA
jgi:NADP-dependent alcohol dehydrogenase